MGNDGHFSGVEGRLPLSPEVVPRGIWRAVVGPIGMQVKDYDGAIERAVCLLFLAGAASSRVIT